MLKVNIERDDYLAIGVGWIDDVDDLYRKIID